MAFEKTRLLSIVIYAIGLFLVTLMGVWGGVKFEIGVSFMVTLMVSIYLGSILMIINK